jgi:hypothetical protein
LLAQEARQSLRAVEPQIILRVIGNCEKMRKEIKPTLNSTGKFNEPQKVKDLAYTELIEILTAILEITFTENETSYYLRLLEVNFPGSDPTNLIYWPNIGSITKPSLVLN